MEKMIMTPNMVKVLRRCANGGVPYTGKIRIAAGLGRTLAALHKRGLIIRDLTNLCIATAEGRKVLEDHQ